MWHCASVCIVIIVGVWIISYGLLKLDHGKIEVDIVKVVNNTEGEEVLRKSKVKHHVPKFMLDLYEKSKNIRIEEFDHSTPDVVRSVVPSHAGKF